MNEQFDKLIIKIFFSVLICLLLYIYKQAHRFLYPPARDQLFKSFSPIANPSDTLHLFSRILGIGIIYSSLDIDMSSGITLAILSMLFKGITGFALYLVSLYIVESITLFNFEYTDEIQKRKNFSYALITFSQSIAISLILKTVLSAAGNSIPLLLYVWIFTMVILGFAVKSFQWLSKLSFNKLVIQKSLSLGISYSGFILGIAIIIVSSFSQNITTPEGYAVQVILNIIKATIVFPFFRTGLKLVFKIDENYVLENNAKNESELNIGHGIYEGVIFFTSSFFTSIIINQIHFGNFYPLFNN